LIMAFRFSDESKFSGSIRRSIEVGKLDSTSRAGIEIEYDS